MRELAAAFGLLTRLPVGGLVRACPDVAETVCAFPIVGACVGAIGGGVYAGCGWLGMPPTVAAVWTLGALVLVTGGLHEDGLADTADGFGGGRSRERKLEIMRDSRIGSFGAIALVLSLAARGVSLAALEQPGRVLAALVVSGAIGRACIAVMVVLLRPARLDGLGAALRETGWWQALVAVLIALAAAFLLLPGSAMVRVVAGALVALVTMALLAWREVGGYTGDVLGATSVVTECLVLGLLAGAM